MHQQALDTGVRYRLSEVIGALSHALDLTEGQPVGHSQRSCMIAMVGFDPVADRQRFKVTDSGLVVISKGMKLHAAVDPSG